MLPTHGITRRAIAQRIGWYSVLQARPHDTVCVQYLTSIDAWSLQLHVIRWHGHGFSAPSEFVPLLAPARPCSLLHVVNLGLH